MYNYQPPTIQRLAKALAHIVLVGIFLLSFLCLLFFLLGQITIKIFGPVGGHYHPCDYIETFPEKEHVPTNRLIPIEDVFSGASSIADFESHRSSADYHIFERSGYQFVQGARSHKLTIEWHSSAERAACIIGVGIADHAPEDPYELAEKIITDPQAEYVYCRAPLEGSQDSYYCYWKGQIEEYIVLLGVDIGTGGLYQDAFVIDVSRLKEFLYQD